MYRHRQIGYSVLIISLVVWIAVAVVDLAAAAITLSIVSTAMIFIVAIVFSTMTIEVTAARVPSASNSRTGVSCRLERMIRIDYGMR
jgi:hypothetical protein